MKICTSIYMTKNTTDRTPAFWLKKYSNVSLWNFVKVEEKGRAFLDK